jgi:histidyl-tRNA synthetase
VKIQTPPGMRDYYPEDMRLQNWLFDAWRAASRSFGFQEYEGPIFEFLDLYRAKSGDEIVAQLFNFRDRGDREFAIRPEMTPTLARMVAARANALPRPIKWFSMPRMCRAEKPQRGRLREFFQWNVDTLGSDDALADAEVIATLIAFVRNVGLTSADVSVRINSRPLMSAIFAGFGVASDAVAAAFALVDRFEKLAAAEFDAQWNAALGASVQAATVRDLLTTASREDCTALALKAGAAGQAAADGFDAVLARLGDLGVAEFARFSPAIVRGLAYYTGVVFELHATAIPLRALCGGGRYDDLTSLFGGPKISGVGFGMGDAPVLEALKELGRLPTPMDTLDAFVIDADAACFQAALGVCGELRASGLTAEFSYKRQPIGKQLKQASDRRARYAVIVGAEIAVKDMTSGEQRTIARADVPAALLRHSSAR